MNAEKRTQTRGSVRYVGMWHTHPNSLPVASTTNWHRMRRLIWAGGSTSRLLILIVCAPHGDNPVLGTYVFRATDYKIAPDLVVVLLCVIRVLNWG